MQHFDDGGEFGIKVLFLLLLFRRRLRIEHGDFQFVLWIGFGHIGPLDDWMELPIEMMLTIKRLEFLWYLKPYAGTVNGRQCYFLSMESAVFSSQNIQSSQKRIASICSLVWKTFLAEKMMWDEFFQKNKKVNDISKNTECFAGVVQSLHGAQSHRPWPWAYGALAMFVIASSRRRECHHMGAWNGKESSQEWLEMAVWSVKNKKTAKNAKKTIVF